MIKNICLFCSETSQFRKGGIQTFTDLYINNLIKNGFNCILITFGPGFKIYRHAFGYKIIQLKYSNILIIKSLINRIKLRLLVNFLFDNNKIDIFEYPEYEGWMPFPFIKYKNSTFVRLHTSRYLIDKSEKKINNYLIYVYEYFTLKSSRNWISVSNFIYNQTSNNFKLIPDNNVIIYNPIAINNIFFKKSFNYINQNILFIGSLSKRKGLYRVAQIQKKLISRGYKYNFIFIGGAPNNLTLSQIKNEYINLSNSNNVLFLGELDHNTVLNYLQNSLLVLIPSDFESYCYVLIESLITGTPFICPNSLVFSEILSNKFQNLQCDINNIESWVEKIIHIKNNYSYINNLLEKSNYFFSNKYDVTNFINFSINYYSLCKKL